MSNDSSEQRSFSHIFIHTFFIGFGILTAFPLLWMLSISFKPLKEFYQSPFGPPLQPTLENYKRIIGDPFMLTFMKNSFFVTIVSVLLILILGSLAAYALARMDFRGKNIILFIFLTTQWVPLVVLIIPLLITMQRLGLYGSLVGLILVYVSANLGISIFILRGFFRGLPQETIDAAHLEGCNDLQAFYFIGLPQIKPGLAVVAILSFIGVWNEYFMALVLINNRQKYTLPIGLSMYQGQTGSNWPMLTATLFLATLPTLLLYISFTDTFIKSASRSAGFGGR